MKKSPFRKCAYCNQPGKYKYCSRKCAHDAQVQRKYDKVATHVRVMWGKKQDKPK